MGGTILAYIFIERPYKTRRDRPFPDGLQATATPHPRKRKNKLFAWRLCIRGDELIANGWDIDLIDTLTPYRYHRWRKKRLFVLADLKDVAQHQPPLLGWKNIRKNQIYGNQWEAEKKERKRVKRLEKKKT